MITHSKYNLVQEGMQNKEQYYVLSNQRIDDIPTDIQRLLFCGYSLNTMHKLDFAEYAFVQLESIVFGIECFCNNEFRIIIFRGKGFHLIS